MLNESRITRKGLARVSVQDKFPVWEEHEEEAERKWQQEVCGEGRVACLRVLDTPSTLHFLIKFLHCKCKMNLALLCSALLAYVLALPRSRHYCDRRMDSGTAVPD